MQTTRARILSRVPEATLEWLLGEDNPAISVLTRRTLLGQADDAAVGRLWARRNDYPPITAILDAQRDDGSWEVPQRDYQKYRGSLWQLVFLGELWADGTDERLQRAADYAFSRQKANGGWSANPKASYEMPCLTANVGRGLARMGWARDARVAHALDSIVQGYRTLGFIGCSDMQPFSLNGYCHMLTPKVLMVLGEVPHELWPEGATELRDACVAALRDKEVFRSLPAEFKEFQAEIWPVPKAQREQAREAFLAEHAPLHYSDKPGWLRFGFPLSYNSDALEALAALVAVSERRRPEYEPAIEAVERAADGPMRWPLKTSFNGKMIGDVECKGAPSKWLTLRALQVLEWFAAENAEDAEQHTASAA